MTNQEFQEKPAVLIIDDHYRAFQPLAALIDPDRFTPVWVSDEQEGLQVLRNRGGEIHIIVVDLKSSGMGGGGIFHLARQLAPQAAVMITGPLGPSLYLEGVFYDLSGPNLKKEINLVLEGIVQKMGLNRSPVKDLDLTEDRGRSGPLVGTSRAIGDLYRLIDRLKDTSATALIQGESGTGKELVARTIHQAGTRKGQVFVAINCGAIPNTLIETELFGHERGAFTTALTQRKGKFEVAEGGTLFLDEIGELPKDLQVKLLRVLQEKEFQRIGGNRTIKTDVRIIAASGRNLREEVEAGRFRDDLFYRLNVVPILIPPLRERREDIPLLLDHFFSEAAARSDDSVPSITREAFEALKRYRYPGNVRELANMVERLWLFCRGREITFSDLPDEVRAEGGDPASRVGGLVRDLPEEGARLQEVERELIHKTLQKTSGNKLAAARMLGITRRRLYLRLGEYGPPFREFVTNGDIKKGFVTGGGR